jgi:hypothetical protein
MFEIDNTRKHYIPRFYLRGFCRKDKSNQVYVYDKSAPEKRIQSRSIENVEVSRDAHSVDHETVIQQKEAVWGDIFNKLRESRADDLNEVIAGREQSARLRTWLAHFVIDIRWRSRGFRDRNKEIYLGYVDN